MTADFENYGEMKRAAETDVRYRVRDDGGFVVLFEPGGDEWIVGLSAEDIEKIAADMD